MKSKREFWPRKRRGAAGGIPGPEEKSRPLLTRLYLPRHVARQQFAGLISGNGGHSPAGRLGKRGLRWPVSPGQVAPGLRGTWSRSLSIRAVRTEVGYKFLQDKHCSLSRVSPNTELTHQAATSGVTQREGFLRVGGKMNHKSDSNHSLG